MSRGWRPTPGVLVDDHHRLITYGSTDPGRLLATLEQSGRTRASDLFSVVDAGGDSLHHRLDPRTVLCRRRGVGVSCCFAGL